jgi:hypothetical protein
VVAAFLGPDASSSHATNSSELGRMSAAAMHATFRGNQFMTPYDSEHASGDVHAAVKRRDSA